MWLLMREISFAAHAHADTAPDHRWMVSAVSALMLTRVSDRNNSGMPHDARTMTGQPAVCGSQALPATSTDGQIVSICQASLPSVIDRMEAFTLAAVAWQLPSAAVAQEPDPAVAPRSAA